MNVELLGLATIFLGAAVLFAPIQRAFSIMVLSTLFGAAAAFSLPGLGGASVLVPNLFLVFYCMRLFMAFGEGPVFKALAPPGAGFWLLILTIYGLLTAMFFPRLLQGITETMAVQRLAPGRSAILLTPLRSSSNNITQSVYALGGLVCFAFTVAYLRRAGTLAGMVGVLLVLAVADLIFAVLDVATYYTGTSELFDFIRTANYALLTDSEKAGFKRISGTFPEASAFAGYTVVLFAVTASLWLDRVRSQLTGILAGLLLLALILSTSTTGLVSLGATILFLGLRAARAWGGARPVFLATVALIIPLVVLFIVILVPSLAEQISGFLDEVLFSKMESQSGRERFLWNSVAYQVFLDTWGLGAGLGSARASSYLLVLLSNVGLVGTILFFIFFASLLLSHPVASGPGADLDRRTVRAAKAGLVAGLSEALVSGTVYDLGLLFYLLAGTVAAAQASSVREAGTERFARVVPAAQVRR